MLISSPLQRVYGGIQSENDIPGHIMLEKNGKTVNFPPGEISTDQITAIKVPFPGCLLSYSLLRFSRIRTFILV